MPGDSGAGLLIRQYLLYGTPWQRAAIVLTPIACGAALIALGYLIGLLPALLGVVIGLRMWGPSPVRASRFKSADRPIPPAPRKRGEDR